MDMRGAAFGPLIGFVTGVLVWLGAVLAAAGIAAALVDGLAGFVPALASRSDGSALS